MKFLKTVLGLAAAATVIPYQVRVDDKDEATGNPGKVTVKSLLYTIEVDHKKDENGLLTGEKDVSLIFPSDALKSLICKVKSKVADCRCHQEEDAEEEEVPEEQITIEVKPEDAGVDPAADPAVDPGTVEA